MTHLHGSFAVARHLHGSAAAPHGKAATACRVLLHGSGTGAMPMLAPQLGPATACMDGKVRTTPLDHIGGWRVNPSSFGLDGLVASARCSICICSYF